MPFVYLSLGILAVLVIHATLVFFMKAEPATIRRAARIAFYAALIVVILLLLRFGLMHIAAIVSFLSVAIPLWDRFQRSRKITSGETVEGEEETPASPSTRSTAMSAEEAREILGVEEGASRKQITDAYKRLIQKNHPDQGGSDYLASQINKARDTLLGKKP